MIEKRRLIEQYDKWFNYKKFVASRKGAFSDEVPNFVLCSIAPPRYKPFNLGANIIDKIVNRSEYFCGRSVYFNREISQEWHSGRKIKDFDVIGISAYMLFQSLAIPGFLASNKIQPLNEFRKESDPIILLGGQLWSYYNTYYKFIDVACIGEGEEFTIDLMNVVKECKSKGLTRNQTLIEISKIQGAFVPSVHDVKNRDFVITKRFVDQSKLHESLNSKDDLDSKYTRKVIELNRGCKYMCSFCSLARNNYPFRMNDIKRIKEVISTYNEKCQIYPFAPDESSFPDHKELYDFAELSNYKYYRYNFRVNTIDEATIAQGNLSNRIVFGIDGISQRVLDIVNKRISLDDFKEKAIKVFEKGYTLMKLNYVFSYPFETDEDYAQLKEYWSWLIERRLEIQGAEGKRTMIQIAPTPFIPEPNTPMYYLKINSHIDSRFKRVFDEVTTPYFDKGISPHLKIEGMQGRDGWFAEILLIRLGLQASDFIYYLYKNDYLRAEFSYRFMELYNIYSMKKSIKLDDICNEIDPNSCIYDVFDWSGGKLDYKKQNVNIYNRLIEKIGKNQAND